MRHSLLSYASLLLMIIVISCKASYKLSNVVVESIFSSHEESLIMKSDSTIPMRVYKINNFRDSVLLRESSTEVLLNSNDPVLNHFINRLYRTVRDSMSLGVGIAAPQVGILKNIIWVQRFDKEDFPFEVYLNPRIIQYSKKKQTRAEGCLSIPNRRETLDCRAYAILIEYDRIDGSHNVEMVEDFTSIIFQHEIDHLNGIMYIDHLNTELDN